jgi:hypothetical protein
LRWPALKQNNARLLYLEQNPEAAHGGQRNAEAELRSLRARRDDASKRHSELLPALEGMLNDMASEWPRDGLSEQQMLSLEYIFVDTPEIRHRLAAKLAHEANRAWLLKRNIAQLQGFLGISKAAIAAPAAYFNLDDRRFWVIVPWVAQSLILLCADEKRDLGKRTSNLVKGIAVAAQSLIQQPFIGARQPLAWQSTITRATGAGIFALRVVASVPETERADVLELNKLALAHAFMMLAARNPPHQSWPLLDRLAASSVQNMGILPSPEDIRKQWCLSEELPDYPRALALWSSPDLVVRHKPLADELFRRVGKSPLSRSGRDLQMSRMLSLLDLAVASHAMTNNPDFLLDIVRLWSEGYRDWHEITDRWLGAAKTLTEAVTLDGPARAAMLANETFAHSYCRQMVERLKEQPAPDAVA